MASQVDGSAQHGERRTAWRQHGGWWRYEHQPRWLGDCVSSVVVIQAPTGDRAIGSTQRRVCSAVDWIDQETVGGGGV